MSTTTAAARRRIENPVIKDAVTFLETSEETGGARTLLEVELAPGGGNSLHRHTTYAERFEAVAGTVTVQVADEVLRLAPGQTATAPVNTMHRFANETDETVTFRVEIAPSKPGFEHALQIAYGLARDGRVRPDGVPSNPLHAALLFEMSEVRIGGAARLLEPVLGLLAALARRRGIERQLVERYAGWETGEGQH